MTRKLLAIAILAFSVAQAGSARAAVISHGTTFIITDHYTGPVAGSYSVNLSDSQLLQLPRFDGTLGTLQAAQISFHSIFAKYINRATAYDSRGESDFFPFPPFLFNERNDTGITATVDASYRLQLFDPSSSSRTLNAPALQASCYDSRDSLIAVSCETQPRHESQNYDGTLPTDAIDLSQFIGPDPLDLYVSLTGLLYGDCDSDDPGDVCSLFLSGADWSGNVSVAYTYDVEGDDGTPGGGTDGGNTVPEPDTYLLLLLGFAAFALQHRSHAQRSRRAA